MITIEQVQQMSRDQCRELVPRLHEQHDWIAYRDNEAFYKPFAYSRVDPIPPKYGWPDLPDDKHAIDVMIIVSLESAGSDVIHIGQVMDEYLTTLETHQATVQDGGFLVSESDA